VSISACSGPPAPHQQFAVELSVQSDNGNPVADAALVRGHQLLGKTDPDGHLSLRISGPEGDLVSLTLTCPDGFVQPKVALPLRLTTTRRVGAKAAAPQKLEAICARKTRDLVVVVHATGGEALPVKVNGEDAGTTDSDGNAHVLLQAERDLKAIEVELDTTARRDIVPSTPRKIFALDGRDSILIVEQPFTARRAATPSSKPHAPRRHVPTRID
jgi:hypothetical protein